MHGLNYKSLCLAACIMLLTCDVATAFVTTVQHTVCLSKAVRCLCEALYNSAITAVLVSTALLAAAQEQIPTSVTVLTQNMPYAGGAILANTTPVTPHMQHPHVQAAQVTLACRCCRRPPQTCKQSLKRVHQLLQPLTSTHPQSANARQTSTQSNDAPHRPLRNPRD